MQTRRLGNTELNLTTVGLGTWAIGGPWEYGWGPQNDKESIATILQAIEKGVNWIDTAAVYGCGHSEEIVGQALKEFREKPIIATKCGLLCDQQRRRVPCLKKESIFKECEGSLKRLGVEVIDLYQMHWNQPAEDIEEGWEAMALMAKQGKVRYIGASNFTIQQLRQVGQIHPVASLQPPYSMLKRAVEDELFGYCRENNIGLVVYSPMQKGLLTGKFNAQRVAELAEDDHRRRDPDFQEPRLSANLELVKGLRRIAEKHNRTVAQLAIAWVLRRAEVTAAIVGARRPEQIAETAPAADWKLSEQDIKEIDVLLQKRAGKLNS